MISILTGLPRSGKSYRAVWYIQKHFIDPKSKDYDKHTFLYTNIGGFKHETVNDILIQNPIDNGTDQEDTIKESIYLDWAWFYPHLQKMHEMAKADKPDEELLRYARYHKLTPALFVIDEAYRFYTKASDPTLVWWHGYHGHLGHDILIIIHRPSLMHSDYKAHTEEFIDAQPKSKALFSNQFRYHFYATDSYNKANRYSTDKLTASPDIFALYKSGDLHNPKKIVYKFLAIAGAGILVVLGLLYYFFWSLKERAGLNDDADIQETAIEQTVNPYDGNVSVAPKSPIASSMLLRVRCDAIACSRVDNAYVTNYIPRLYFEEALKMIDFKLLAGSTVRVFDVEYNDRLFSIPSDSIKYFSMWNIPLVQKSGQKQMFGGGASDVINSAGGTQ